MNIEEVYLFNALKYTQELEEAGLEPDTAKRLVNAVIDMINTGFISRQDFELYSKDMRIHLERIDSRFIEIERKFEEIDRRFEQIDRRFEDIDRRFEEIDKKFEYLENRIHEKLQLLSSQMTVKLGTLQAISVGLIVTLIKFT